MRACLFLLLIFSPCTVIAGHVHHAVNNGDIGLVTLLIDEYGEDVNEIEGLLTPLDRAFALGRWDIARVLVDRGGVTSAFTFRKLFLAG